MRTMTFAGTYGSGRTPCTVFATRSGSFTWYAVEGSRTANCTLDRLQDGVDVEYVSDVDTLTWNVPIRTADDLVEAVHA